MIRNCSAILSVLLICLCLVYTNDVYATRLEINPDASSWAHFAAAILLYLHIGGGGIGLLAGTTASIAPKGRAVHRAAGKIFLVAMLITYTIGAGVAPFLAEGQRPNFVGGILALYLLITGVIAAKRKVFHAGLAEIVGLMFALLITATGVLFMYMGANSESGTVDGSPPQAFFIFVFVGAIAAIGELNVIIRRTLSNTARISRHLWRVCLSFFFASGSLFLGQPQVFPDWFNESILPSFLAVAPVLIAVIWAVKVRLKRFKKRNFASGTTSSIQT